ncbi:septum formation initiator [Tetragenococcus halophilus subsp. flandriensis]|uniref:septum formation initiator family protein n=1 Tax=Tetragenococcus halophilus TaxID=51669 RepID=UPI0023E9D295|nr:septum formation initiator family protein [Tetragenococcus halophilus]GMA08333.1 septum formation initiator [Tetragenococcus halophilus subsp. flandriensis]
MKNPNKPSITHLNNTYTKEKTKQAMIEKRQRTFFKHRMTVIIVCGMILVALTSFPLVRNMIRAHALEEEKEVALQELEELELHQEELEYYVGLLNDEEYLAKLARSEYYLTQDNEIVFSFPEDETPDYQRMIEEEKEETQDEESEENEDK